MNDYASALKAYLEQPDRSQKALADAIGTSQPSVARYARGERFPENVELARKIDAATDGEVPLGLWQRVAMARLGITDEDGATPAPTGAHAPDPAPEAEAGAEAA